MKATMLAGALAAAVLTTAAHADFNAALADYKNGHYDSARRQFTAMAELGDCSSQFNLGVMVLQGQGGAKDLGTGVGWLEAAAANGCQELVGGRVTAAKGSLTQPQEHTAADVMARYGHEALHAAGIVDPDLSCSDRSRAAVTRSPAPEYPSSGSHRNGLVIGEITIGRDGRARDPEILLAAPDEAFVAPAVEAWLYSRFTPATDNGRPVESRLQVRAPFTSAGAEPLWSGAAYKDKRAAADAGDPAAEYLVGLAATADPALGIGAARGAQLVIVAARDGNPQAQYWLGEQLRSVAVCHPQANGAAWLRHAAAGGDAAAELMVAADLVSASPTDAQVKEAHTLLEHAAGADSYYVRKHVVAILAASPLAALRDPAIAQQVASRLAHGDIQSDPQMFEALAAAAAAGGDFSAAVSHQQQAIRKARDLEWDTRAMEQRLASYKGGKAWQGDLFAD